MSWLFNLCCVCCVFISREDAKNVGFTSKNVQLNDLQLFFFANLAI